jgi:hypothetical protein
MDASVIASIAHWPNVPHVYGWLSLDRRGRWRLQDSPIANPHITDFIGRNYGCDGEKNRSAAWFFQNGPQRVYVRLDYTPWVLRIGEDQMLITHTGAPVSAMHEALLDENGNLLITFEGSVGVIEDRDLPALLDCICDASGRTADEAALTQLMDGSNCGLSLAWHGVKLPLSPIRSSEVALRYGFIADPQPD